MKKNSGIKNKKNKYLGYTKVISAIFPLLFTHLKDLETLLRLLFCPKDLNNTNYIICIMKERLMTFRLPLEIDKEIENLASLEDTDKSKLIRELLKLGIKERKLKEALKLYMEGKITLWKATRLAGISLWKMIEILEERKITLQYGERELKEDLKALKE